MSPFASITGQLPAAVVAACERLLHPATVDADERNTQRRLMGLCLIGSFAWACATASIFWTLQQPQIALASIILMLGGGWLCALVLSAFGTRAWVEAPLLGASAVAQGLMVAAAGGLSSPSAVMLSSLLLEAIWVRRDRKAAIGGALAVAGAAGLAVAIGMDATTASPFQWLPPILYGATIALRVALARSDDASRNARPFDLEQALDVVVAAVGENNEISYVSTKTQSVLGLPGDLLYGAGLFDRIHVADRVAYLTALAESRAGRKPADLHIRMRLPQPHVQGGFITITVAFAPSQSSGGAVAVILRRDRELEDVRDELRVALDKVDSAEIGRTRLLAAVSHELRTPLNAIIGFSDMMLHELFGQFRDRRQKEYVELIRESGQHLLSVVNSMLDVSKTEAGVFVVQPERFVFKETVDQCSAMLGQMAREKRITVSHEIAGDGGSLFADRRAVKQMLINLISNAVKFTPEGGRVTVGSKRVGSRLHFWVADNGIGMSSADLSRIGQPFVQVDADMTRRCEGAGLGLSLVKAMVKLHNGKMSIESEPDVGSTVTIVLPIDGPSGTIAEIRPANAAEGPSRNHRHAALLKTA